MRRRLAPLPLSLFLLMLLIGAAFAAVGVQERSGEVNCPGENVPRGSGGEEVPGPMHPGDVSCGVIRADGSDGGNRTYEQQKAVQWRAADWHLGTGALLVVAGGAGFWRTGRTARRGRWAGGAPRSARVPAGDR